MLNEKVPSLEKKAENHVINQKVPSLIKINQVGIENEVLNPGNNIYRTNAPIMSRSEMLNQNAAHLTQKCQAVLKNSILKQNACHLINECKGTSQKHHVEP